MLTCVATSQATRACCYSRGGGQKVCLLLCVCLCAGDGGGGAEAGSGAYQAAGLAHSGRGCYSLNFRLGQLWLLLQFVILLWGLDLRRMFVNYTIIFSVLLQRDVVG